MSKVGLGAVSLVAKSVSRIANDGARLMSSSVLCSGRWLAQFYNMPVTVDLADADVKDIIARSAEIDSNTAATRKLFASEVSKKLREDYRAQNPDNYQIITDAMPNKGAFETDHVAIRSAKRSDVREPDFADWLMGVFATVFNMRGPDRDVVIRDKALMAERKVGIERDASGILTSEDSVLTLPVEQLEDYRRVIEEMGLPPGTVLDKRGDLNKYLFPLHGLWSTALIGHSSTAELLKDIQEQGQSGRVKGQTPLWRTDDRAVSLFLSHVSPELMGVEAVLYGGRDPARAELFQRMLPGGKAYNYLAGLAGSDPDPVKAAQCRAAAEAVGKEGDYLWEASAGVRGEVDAIAAKARECDGYLVPEEQRVIVEKITGEVFRRHGEPPRLSNFNPVAEIFPASAAALAVGVTVNHLAFDAVVAGFGDARVAHNAVRDLGIELSNPEVGDMGNKMQGSTSAVEVNTVFIDDVTTSHAEREVVKKIKAQFIEWISRGGHLVGSEGVIFLRDEQQVSPELLAENSNIRAIRGMKFPDGTEGIWLREDPVAGNTLVSRVGVTKEGAVQMRKDCSTERDAEFSENADLIFKGSLAEYLGRSGGGNPVKAR